MADETLITPLLCNGDSDESHLIIAINDDVAVDDDDDVSCSKPSNQTLDNVSEMVNGTVTNMVDDNPYAFLGAKRFEVTRSVTVDPFRNDTPKIEGVYEWLKIVVCLPIAILRLVLFGLSLMVGYVATKTALFGWKDRENPMPKWRSKLMCVTRFCGRTILFSFGYQWIKRRGKPAPREIAPIIVSNHVSYIDPIFFFYELCPSIVASESHDSMNFVGTIIRSMQVIYVNRFVPSSRKNAVNEIKRRASCNQFPQVLLFPEGTTSNGKVIMSFQLGAFVPGYPIQPVVVRYPHVHFDQSWVGNVSLPMLMLRMFTQFHNFMEVEYLPVVSPLQNKKETAIHFAERTRHAVAAALNVVQTSHSYGDSMLFAKAWESNQDNPSLYMVEMAGVESVYNLSSSEAVGFLEIFLSMNPDPRGLVEIHDFLKVLRLKPCTLSEKIFDFIDTQKNGKITFKQFLLGSAHILKQPIFYQACESAFTQCDVDGKNCILEQELGDSILLAIPGLSNTEIHGLFTLFDIDFDGKISKDDFISCLKRNPLLIALFSPYVLHHTCL